MKWVSANMASAILIGTMALTLAFAYCAVHRFSYHGISVLGWAWSAWTPETHYEHARLIPLIMAFLVWHAWPGLRGLRSEPSGWGLAVLFTGVLLYVAAARTFQPRLAMAALPFLLVGMVLYAAGWKVTRVLLFPIVCLFFAIPLPGVDQATVRLQLIATQGANFICNLIGIKMIAVGTTLRAVNESFRFEIADGCSGINSLVAITLMTAIFAHLTQDRVWKKILLFSASIPVAIFGNIARLVCIMIVAKTLGQSAAGGWFHDISAYVVSFPFAFGALCLIHKAMNWSFENQTTPKPPWPVAPSRAPLEAKVISYDY